MKKNLILNNMLGHFIDKESLFVFVENLNQFIENEKRPEIPFDEITLQFLVSAYKHNKQILIVINNLLETGDIKTFIDEIDYSYSSLEIINEKTLDLRVTEEQCKQVNLMLEKYQNLTLDEKSIKEIICQNTDLFCNSFDSGITDTYSRSYFVEVAIDLGILNLKS